MPARLRQWLSGADSREEIDDHLVHVAPAWWARNLAAYRFDNPVVETTLTRGQLFAMADAAVATQDGALRLLWNTLAWGEGRGARNHLRRIATIAADPEAYTALLREAAQVRPSDAVAAYTLLRPSPYRNAMRSLGPAFLPSSSTSLAVAAPITPAASSMTGSRAALRAAGWSGLARNGWRPQMYGRYMRLLSRWRDECGCARTDLIERWLFDTGAAAK